VFRVGTLLRLFETSPLPKSTSYGDQVTAYFDNGALKSRISFMRIEFHSYIVLGQLVIPCHIFYSIQISLVCQFLGLGPLIKRVIFGTFHPTRTCKEIRYHKSS
jgi:hypothetical protein